MMLSEPLEVGGCERTEEGGQERLRGGRDGGGWGRTTWEDRRGWEGEKEGLQIMHLQQHGGWHTHPPSRRLPESPYTCLPMEIRSTVHIIVLAVETED